MGRAALAEHYQVPALQPQQPDPELLIATIAYMDDTDFISHSQQGLQDILEIATSFLVLNALEINPKKTELVVINPNAEDLTVRFGADTITAHPATKAVRSLGVWFSADGKGAHTRQIVSDEVSTICAILSRKALTDKQTVYIINNVLIPRILYRLTTTVLFPAETNAIVRKYTAVCVKNWDMPK
ncbi:hypothetical protein BGZ68_004222, partial [Mortierella alpina]